MALGKKQLDQLATYTSSLLAYGAAAAVFTFYLTDWKAVVAYIPFYNGKFKGQKKTDDGCN